MRRLWTLIVIIACITVLLLYIQPDARLNLSYSYFTVSNKVKEMIQSKQLAFHLTEEDINNLLKKELNANPQLGNGFNITGAAFELHNSQLIAHLSLLYYGLVPLGCEITYQLKWASPYLEAVPVSARVKSITIPLSLFSIPEKKLAVEQMLPSFLFIKNITFEKDSILIQLYFK